MIESFFNGVHMRNCLLALLLLIPAWAMAGEQCVDSDGDAGIVHGDIASAKLEAVARAKWAAIEQTVGVQIHATSLVQDMALVDDNVIQKTSGVIRSYHILDEQQQDGLYQVRAHVCVSPAAAEQSVGLLTRNTAVGVLIVSRSRQENDVVETSHSRSSHEFETLHLDADPLSASIKQGLIDQEIKVVDLSDKLKGSGDNLARALQRSDVTLVRRAMLASMANVLIFGRIDNIISTHKGADIGYGLSMPMHKVTSRLSYKVLGRQSNGTVQVIGSGTAQGLGMATALEDANQQAMQDLSKQKAGGIIDSIVSQIDGKAIVVNVSIDSVPDVDAHERIKDRLHQIQWVQEVKDKGNGHFKVKYLEKIIYLANSLQRIDGLRVTDFSNLSIHGKYGMQ